MRLMGGPDEIEAPAVRHELPGLQGPLAGLRVALWKTDPMCPSSAAVVRRVEAVAAALAAQGARVDDAARPEFSAEHSHEVFSALLAAAMSARMPDEDYARLVAKVAAAGPNDDSPVLRQARWQTMRARDWSRINEARTRIRWAWHRFFQQHDVLITPIMPTGAFAHDQRPFGERRLRIDGRDYPYFTQTFWAGLAGVAYLPGTVIPGGADDEGLPVGVQLIGPAYGDLRTIQLAQRLEAMGFAFTPPPTLD
jgi:amidase